VFSRFRRLQPLPGFEEMVQAMEAEAQSLDFAPTYEELREENELLTETVQDYATTVAAARHLLQVMIQASAAGKPLFAINDEELDLQSRRMLRHAIISLDATLEGTEPPAIALEINPTEIN
jgi:hypothetical protein